MTDHAPTPAPETKTAKPAWLSGGRAGYLALGLSVIALGFSAAPYLTGGSNVRAYLLKHPEVLQEAQMALQTKDAEAAVEETNQAAAANAEACDAWLRELAGSGILSLAAGKLNPAARIVASDFDEQCVAATAENAAENGVQVLIPVLINRADDLPDVQHIAIDYETAMRTAVQMFLRAGCRRIALVSRAVRTPSLQAGKAAQHGTAWAGGALHG